MIIAIGPFPPPISGFSIVTARAAEILERSGQNVIRYDVSPPEGKKGFFYHFSRARAYFRCIRDLIRRPSEDKVYLALSGGFGLIYDLAVVAIASLGRRSVVFHHHSFAYLTRKSKLLTAIVAVSRRESVHITLCSNMAAKLRDVYGEDLNCCTISNLAFFDFELNKQIDPRRCLSVIGFLSNVSFEKGVDRFLDFVAEMRRAGSRVKGRIAGPFVSNDVETYVSERMKEIGDVEYVGPVYDTQKAEFLASIDMFVFPSRYRNEAQPMVVYEALLAGALTASSDRGCLSEMLHEGGGIVLDPVGENLSPLVDQALHWEREPQCFREAVHAATEKRATLVSLGNTDRERFVSLFLS